MAVLAAALIGLLGVLIGVVLRPFVEELYARRTKTLILLLNDDQRKLTAPRGSGLGLSIGSRPVDNLYYRTFALKNKTGRTLRDFQLEFEMRFDRGAISKTHFEFDTSEGSIILKDEGPAGSELFVFSVRRCDRGQVTSGRILSTHLGIVKCRANNDLEVKVVEERAIGPRVANALPAILVILLTILAFGYYIWVSNHG